MLRYSISIKWSDEDGGFIATVPELPGLSAFGETQQEAISELAIAREAYLESLEESGELIPEPEKLIPYSGQIRLRMPKSLHSRLASTAEKEGVSLNTHIVFLLSGRLAEKELFNRFTEFTKAVNNSLYTILLNGTIKAYPKDYEQAPSLTSENSNLYGRCH